MNKKFVLLLTISIIFVLFLLGCTTEQPDSDIELVKDEISDETDNVNEPEQSDKLIDAEKPLPKDSGIIDSLFCNTSSDCEIKDIGSCCGEYPSCVNKDFIPDVEAVIKECEESGISQTCEYPVIIYCVCIKNSCVSNDKPVERLEPIII